ncbi:hypothetical protein H4R20_003163 [Coemansia guatemalensis]|uniref:Chromo domain-containing protein n=1 Tax=Coemansia guatemalensis TaxID=2761395 RepID=A0A9W8I2E4_9FUNG|nr:hypothetical protein H4R20_003163 [Coemansia guatemalensis]
MFGRDIRSPAALCAPVDKLTSELTLANLAKFRDVILHPQVARQLSEYQSRMAKSFATNNLIKQFEVGDLVLAQILPRPPADRAQYCGPFEISAISCGGAISLKAVDMTDAPQPPARKYAHSQLMPADDLPPQSTHSYEVDFVDQAVITKDTVWFRVHWRGYQELGWIPAANFADPSLLQEFARSLGSADRRRLLNHLRTASKKQLKVRKAPPKGHVGILRINPTSSP